ncbi:MAG: molybdopterin oxidoreductase family protein [Proteobacteria bacterium]|nr:molybdopterin oxidoreductase family protein [Pseudomonadota bacterium]
MPRQHHRTCHICEASCGIVVTLEGREVVSIKGDPDHALSRGHICPKATAIADLQADPDRLRQPHKRVGDQWQAIGWDQAFTEIGERVRALLARDPASVALYLGNPNAHNYATTLNSGPLFKALGRPQIFSASTVDQIPHQVVNLKLFGHSALWSIPDIENTETLIVLGGNPMASNGSLWVTPGFRERAKALRARGGQLIVIDPRRGETAEIADRHLFVRPGTDAFLLVALLKAVLARGPARLPDWVDGWGEVEAALAAFDAAECAAIAAVPMAEIDHLAERLTRGPAALYGRMGVATQVHGTLNCWLIALINLAAGQMDRTGGIVFPKAPVDLAAALGPGSMGRRTSRVSGYPDVFGEFPASALAEEIDTPGAGQVRGLFLVAGNPVLSVPNGARLGRAMEGLDLIVAVDMYRTASTRLAHYILPPVGPLERDHYGLFQMAMAARNFGKYSPPALEPEAGALQDWEILRGLAGAISGQPVQAPAPREMLDGLLRAGPYGLTLAELEAAESGIDFGAVEGGQLPARLKTRDQRLHCAPAEFLAALARLPAEAPEPAGNRLHLIGRRHVRTNNSWLANSRRLTKGPDRCTLLIHPDDARARGLADGAEAQVTSKSGAVRLKAELSDSMMPGTVSIPHGWGHGLPGVALSVAAERPGVSVNDLTDETAIDPLSNNAGLAGVMVEVAPV